MKNRMINSRTTPETGTYILRKNGERVIDNQLKNDLKEFLDLEKRLDKVVSRGLARFHNREGTE